MHTTHSIRKAFLDFFAQHDHQLMSSCPLVPYQDPSLLFTNSGMVQFKNVFTGIQPRPYKRATTAQKCLRVGGKHNDLDNVGYTARHHTFFEMLGNFSFGDYFKEQAIYFAWTLITQVFALPASRLLVTVYMEDEEALGLWRKISGLEDSRIIRISTSDNFWRMGEKGPCGPCSEIFYDHGPEVKGAPPGSQEPEGDRFIEIWNLVFMQFEQLEYDLIPLPHPSIDTGMGLERMAAVLQGKQDNYDTDILRTLILESARLTQTDPDGVYKIAHRVVVDHLRASAFLIAEGIWPSHEGRGYVLRRIIRRAIRHIHGMKASGSVLGSLVAMLVEQMGSVYPELEQAQSLIRETLQIEEERFRQTLTRGLSLLETEIRTCDEVLPGTVVFKLYDTYGFPVDLTEDILRAQGMRIDFEGFEKAMSEQRRRARQGWKEIAAGETQGLWFTLRDQYAATEFLGYDTETAEAEIYALVVDGKTVEQVDKDTRVIMVVNQTPFYAESGGQVGDTGFASTLNDAHWLRIDDTQKYADTLIGHHGVVTKGCLRISQTLRLHIDSQRHQLLCANHSATHLLHQALRTHLGHHVMQKGSRVASDRLRFDVSHPWPITSEQLDHIEQEVNEQIIGNDRVMIERMTLQQARHLGARALFGEKYADEVRVVSMGRYGDQKQQVYSIELCGGTHVAHTGAIGLFKILGESSVAAGVRRIEAVTGIKALSFVKQRIRYLEEIAQKLKTEPQDVLIRITALLEECRQLKKQESQDLQEIVKRQEIKGVLLVITATAYDKSVKTLKNQVDSLKQQIRSGVVITPAINKGKCVLIVGITDDLSQRLSAVDLVRVGALEIGGQGGGGGHARMAQSGGQDISRLQDAIASIQKCMEEKLDV